MGDDSATLQFDHTSLAMIAAVLTDDQQQCILNLSPQWQDQGYSSVMADLIWATDHKFYPDRFDPLIERKPGITPSSFTHRLLPLGVAVKHYLQHNAI